MPVTQKDLRGLMSTVYSRRGQTSRQIPSAEQGIGWILVQVDSDNGSREDLSIIYNPIIAVKVDHVESAKAAKDRIADLIEQITKIDVNRELSIYEYREILTDALRLDGFTAHLVLNTFIDWDEPRL